jgi:VIT1/CCC1 family predicted Fe2+/Mn2+ transporter
MSSGAKRRRRVFCDERRPAMAKDHGPQIKDDALYEALRKQGNSPEKAARIANAKAAGTIDHKSTRLEDRTKDELLAEARKIGIAGRSKMSKAELVDAVRGH